MYHFFFLTELHKCLYEKKLSISIGMIQFQVNLIKTSTMMCANCTVHHTSTKILVKTIKLACFGETLYFCSEKSFFSF